MTTSSGGGSHFKFGGKAALDERAQRGEKLTAGVPMVKLIKRRMIDAQELVMLGQQRSIAGEQFRRLKTMLINEHKDEAQVLVVTSAAPSEGKSMVSVNLALAFAADQQGDVLLIDADLRRPTVERWLNPQPKLGLAEILLGQTELDHAIIELENAPLKVLTAGTPPADPVELLSSEAARSMIATLRERFVRIIIDTPPIIPFTDADAIGSQCDGVLLVVRSGVTRQAMFTQAVSSVTSTRVLGTVFNDVTFNLADRENYAYQSSYYSYYDKERKR